jgi:hypothetical protein
MRYWCGADDFVTNLVLLDLSSPLEKERDTVWMTIGASEVQGRLLVVIEDIDEITETIFMI